MSTLAHVLRHRVVRWGHALKVKVLFLSSHSVLQCPLFELALVLQNCLDLILFVLFAARVVDTCQSSAALQEAQLGIVLQLLLFG